MNKLEFECGLGFPVLYVVTNVKTIVNNNSYRDFEYKLFYDYVLDEYFQIHPYRIWRVDISELPDDFFEKTLEKALANLNEGFAKNIELKGNSEIEDVYYNSYIKYSLPYNFVCEIGDEVKFNFDKLSLDKFSNQSSYTNERNTKRPDLKKAIKELYNVDTFVEGILKQAKMKYCYKSNLFNIEAEKYINLESLDEDEELLLAKEFYLYLNHKENNICICSDEVKAAASAKVVLDILNFDESYNNQLIIFKDNKFYSLIPCLMNTYIDIFEDYEYMPFVIKKEIVGDEKKIIIEKIFEEMLEKNIMDADLFTELAISLRGGNI